MSVQKKVLIIDDDDVILMQLEKFLQQNSFATVCANDGSAGLEKAQAEKPDIIFLDRRMPEMDGNETLIRLKTDDATKTIPVIMLTADNRISDIATSMDLGAIDYIVKPFDFGNLLTRLNKALDQGGE